MGVQDLIIRKNPRKRKKLEINPNTYKSCIRIIFQEQRLVEDRERSQAVLNWPKILSDLNNAWELREDIVNPKTRLRMLRLRNKLKTDELTQYAEITLAVDAWLNEFELTGKIRGILDKLGALQYCGLCDIKYRQTRGGAEM